MTHLTPEDGYHGMKKNGIKLTDMGDDALIYKPPGFWISLNSEWEDWCTGENFRNVSEETICDVYLKPNLLFIRISSVAEADELMSYLLPELDYYKTEPDLFSLSDLITISRYTTDQFHRGNRVTPRIVWQKALESCDGIYYENSWDLHMHSIFNTWDCSSIMIFDPRNVSIIKKDRIIKN